LAQLNIPDTFGQIHIEAFGIAPHQSYQDFDKNSGTGHGNLYTKMEKVYISTLTCIEKWIF
jgi:hypothetical protein